MKAMLEKAIKMFSKDDKVIFGVCKRIAEKTGAKIAIVRVVAMLTVLFVAYKPVVIAYLIAGLVISHRSPQSEKPAEEKTETE